MTHFAGYLLREGAAPAATAQRAVLDRMARSPGLQVQERSSPRFWIACQTVPAWRSDDTLLSGPDALVAMAGDALMTEGDEAPTAEQSAARLRAALLGDTPAALAAAQGTFAAAAWDIGRQQLTLAVDKVASRCLYVREQADRVSFATSLRLLRALAPDGEAVDEQGLAETLFFGQPLGARTVFQGVRVLRPAQRLRVSGALQVNADTYADMMAPAPAPHEPEAVLERLHQVFARAVRRRLQPGPQEAFLSGGMDSRAVVAALVDAGVPVRSFCTAYAGSIDDVVGRIVAQRFGTAHETWHRTPAERVRIALDPFALYARDHFPPRQPAAARQLWSGDGGSVTLGHVYMTRPAVELASGPISADTIRRLFPGLAHRPTRQVAGSKAAAWAEMATAGALEEFRTLQAAAPDRRLFQFYMRNDQARHLYHHFEAIDQSGIELLTPFFDGEFVALVASLPIDGFLYHGVYNEWIKHFRCGAGDIYWQPYRGHQAGPHPSPVVQADQWDGSWYEGADVRRAYREVLDGLLATRHGLAEAYVSRPRLRAIRWLNAAGVSRYNFEIAYARNVVGQLGPA